MGIAGGSHAVARSSGTRNGVSCNYAQSSDCLPCVVVRHSMHGPVYSRSTHTFSRIALFSTALAIQIFGPKEPATVATLGVECLILVLFGVMSVLVMQLFSRNDDEGDGDDGDSSDDSEEKTSSHTGSRHDVEEGLEE